ncbi:MAG: 3-ketoacyl-ACP reductase [Planctomycetota bacterium]|jgi:NAD(P)-dependent dehydrogenase (short-subunit alcohol dehydrogenase family)
MIEKPVALVTGGSRGIGRAICLEVARAGYHVVINYNENLGAAEETRVLVEKAGSRAEVCQGDISAKSHRDLMVATTMEKLGRIDLLVNNAGVAPKVRRDVLQTDEVSFDHILDVNLKAPYFLTQRVANEMVALRQAGAIEHAAIVNLSSLRRYTAAKNYGEYCISKAGVSMVTKLFAVRLAEFGINVYEISPGIIETDMTSADNVRDYYNGKLADGMSPINRWGKPEDVARAVGAIARGDFPFTTGAIFDVDGGFHLREL